MSEQNTDNVDLQQIYSQSLFQTLEDCKIYIDNQLVYLYLKYKDNDQLYGQLIKALEYFGKQNHILVFNVYLDLLKSIVVNNFESFKYIKLLSVYNILLKGVISSIDSFNSLKENDDDFHRSLEIYTQSIDCFITLLNVPSFICEIEQQRIYNGDEYEELITKSKQLVNSNELLIDALSTLMMSDSYLVTKKYHWSILIGDKLLPILLQYIGSYNINNNDNNNNNNNNIDIESFSTKRLYWTNKTIDSIAKRLLDRLLQLTDTSSLIEILSQKKNLILKQLLLTLSADNESKWLYNIVVIQSFTTIVSLTSKYETAQLLELFNPHIPNIIINLIHCSDKSLKLHACRILDYTLNQLNDQQIKTLILSNQNSIYDN
ncbi:hypothetical protein PPL_04204 [Heterostelium album PN500]|uniref:Uncharacterized protein n=1 Tax=Heterostelium pallidum (strain ATCC 26659 / Pp 5 / PN500) TaxID=670386 RepID=D3B6X3_HETP5|nr:hypothetical protein PPL_04204 [Heterostelium album PN500]EFA82516.1 hypothetical protein PPL_04204 [Heterostelium album PN500]|eukprot:XP_020434633.1 hypothetical protein PPL_04204 [Heterostelium album PN500]